ncbi:helix-turn-helix domain-containing protein [Chloroflexota bacterium]
MNSNNVHWTDFLSVAEAAELCHVSRVTIHRWIERGRLNAVRIGKNRFLMRQDIEAICATHDGADMEARLRSILARRTPGWTFTLVGELTESGTSTMVALGPDGERVRFRLEVLEESGSEAEE